MTILGLQGLRGGVGTTSVAAALGWALQTLGESVIIVDACPDNLLRLFFNDALHHRGGWARALIDGGDWRGAGMRYTSQIDFLPFGQLTPAERLHVHSDEMTSVLHKLTGIVTTLQHLNHYQWILLDIPHGFTPWTQSLIAACHHVLTVVRADANCHIRLHQQVMPANGRVLINDLRIGSQVQDDLYRVWLESQPQILPLVIHRDEAMAECLAAKQPVGEYRGDALSAEEMVTLANWCLLHYAQAGKPS